jgi:ParB-like chromosome segregation protein Spo0J
MSGIHPSLKSLAVDIETLDYLEGNPRIGNVDAIMASYSEFGQVKPIVAKRNEDGTSTVIAGNHQLEAAINLGWEQIAVIFLDADDKKAIAFALADNRTMELGYTEPELLTDMLLEISEYYPDLLDGLGWDEFELASMESDMIIEQARMDNAEEEIPQTREQIAEQKVHDDAVDSIKGMVQKDGSGENRIVANSNLDHSDIATRGSTIAVPGSAPQAAVQYTIVFDNAEQQAQWYKFIKWLRSDPAVDGDTTAEKLINFIDPHMP